MTDHPRDRPDEPDEPDDPDGVPDKPYRPMERHPPGHDQPHGSWKDIELHDDEPGDGDTPTATDEERSPSLETRDDVSEVPSPGGPEGRISRWDAPGIIDHPDRPDIERIHLTDERRGHILDGDPYGGGHRAGSDRANKTEFPPSWNDDYIVDNILDVARRPDDPPDWQHWNRRWLVFGVRDGVEVNAVLLPDGRVWTAFPLPGSPGVKHNPRDTG